MCIAAAIAGAAVVGAGATIYEGNKASSAQTSAANNANQTQINEYNQTRTDQAPWRAAGGQAVNALSQFYGQGGVNADGTPGNVPAPDYNAILSGLPGYQFQLQQGNQAVQQNLAARGLLQSGAAGKALTQYGQGVAQDYAGQYVNGLQSLAGLGQTATQATSAAGANAANQIGGNQIYAGNANASGYANQSNAINSGLSGLVNAYGYYKNPSQQSGLNGWGSQIPASALPAGMTYGQYNSSLDSLP